MLTAAPSLYPISILDVAISPAARFHFRQALVPGKVLFERYNVTPQIALLCRVPGLGSRGILG
jgi:hypothetical protein